MKFVAFIASVLLVGGCALPERGAVSTAYAAPPAALYSVGGIGFGGPAISHFTPGDVRQITKLAKNRSDIVKPVYGIYATTPTRAEVSAGGFGGIGSRGTDFDVQKRNGRWEIIRGSVHQTHRYFIGSCPSWNLDFVIKMISFRNHKDLTMRWS